MAKEKGKEQGNKSNNEKSKTAFMIELRRQSLHLLFGIAVIALALVNYSVTLWFLFYFLLFSIFLSLLQLKFKFPQLSEFLELFERAKYRKKFPFKGGIFFIAGCLLTLKLFSLDIALAAIAILTFGDSLSHLVGKLGKRKNLLDASKNIEGGLVGVLVGTAAASFFVSFLFAFIASVLAMLAEALSLKLQEEEVDDNIIIPLVAGTVLFLLQRYV